MKIKNLVVIVVVTSTLTLAGLAFAQQTVGTSRPQDVAEQPNSDEQPMTPDHPDWPTFEDGSPMSQGEFDSMTGQTISPELNPVSTIYDLMETADHVLDVTIKNLTHHTSDIGLPEAYTVLHLEGTVINSSGPKRMSGVYKMRINGYHSLIMGSRRILIVKYNGLVPNPIMSLPSDYGRGMEGFFRITEDDTVLTESGKTILFMEDGMPITGRHFNQCQHEDYVILNPQAIDELNSVLSFQCPDGTQWHMGNDRPSDFDDVPMTAEEFVDDIQRHMATLRLPDADVSTNFRTPSSKSMNFHNRLDATASSDAFFMEHMHGRMAHLIDEWNDPGRLVQMYDRIVMRGDVDTIPPRMREKMERFASERDRNVEAYLLSLTPLERAIFTGEER